MVNGTIALQPVVGGGPVVCETQPSCARRYCSLALFTFYVHRLLCREMSS